MEDHLVQRRKCHLSTVDRVLCEKNHNSILTHCTEKKL